MQLCVATDWLVTISFAQSYHYFGTVSYCLQYKQLCAGIYAVNYKALGQNCGLTQGRRNVFTTGPAKLDHEDYAIKCVGGRQLYKY